MSEPHLSCSLHLHDAEVKVRWVRAPHEPYGGFVSLDLGPSGSRVTVLLFTEDQVDRVIEVAYQAKKIFQEKENADAE